MKETMRQSKSCLCSIVLTYIKALGGHLDSNVLPDSGVAF